MSRIDHDRFYETDKAISKRLNAIYSDPTRHKFVSCFEMDEQEDRRGPRGGKIRGRKTICGHCGFPEPGHAFKDEQI